MKKHFFSTILIIIALIILVPLETEKSHAVTVTCPTVTSVTSCDYSGTVIVRWENSEPSDTSVEIWYKYKTEETWKHNTVSGYATYFAIQNLTNGSDFYVALRAVKYSNGKYYNSKFTSTYSVKVYTKYTISYNSNDGSGAPSSQTKFHGKSITLSNVVPTRTGYTFQGWSESSDATSATYQPGGTYRSNKDIVLYAVWKKNSPIVQSVKLNTWYSGITPTEECNYYKFRTTNRSDSKYKCIIHVTNAESNSNRAIVQLGNTRDIEDNTVIAWADPDGSNSSEVLQYQANTTHPFLIYSDLYRWWWGETIEYEFMIKEVIAAPAKGRVESLKRGKGKIKATWRKLGKASYYEYAYKEKGGSYEHYYTSKRNSGWIWGLNSKKYYYFKVRGIREIKTEDGGYREIYGKWSNVKKIKVK